MREYPLFVPHDSGHLAAVLTVPDDDADGLVVLVTGIGAPRSHRFQMWTRLARRLADRGLASVRFDYHGMGDSTGTALEWGDDWDTVLLAETMAVANEAMRATGTRRVAIAGNCAGAELAGTTFVQVDVTSNQVDSLNARYGVIQDPAVLVLRPPGDLVVRIDGFADRDTVAQAATNAAS